jgi:four helix bundle protein
VADLEISRSAAADREVESRKAKVENEMEKDLEIRTKRFALSVIKLVAATPRSPAADVIGRQLLRSATSIGANYREANRGVSRADFANKIGIVQKEASETQYWLELAVESEIFDPTLAAGVLQESTELLAIFTTIGKKLRD